MQAYCGERPAAATKTGWDGDGMACVPGGLFIMGSDRHYPEEKPAHRVRVDPFCIDQTPVTNLAFAQFVAATGYVTLAERPLDPRDYPGAQPELLVPGALVFHMTAGPVDTRNIRHWWDYVPGACWRHPGGPGTGLRGLDHHPVIHVAHEDTAAFAAWTGKSLPTEAEWEFAARGGGGDTEFAWGDELIPGGRIMANTWQGQFPFLSFNPGGIAGTSPVGSFPANSYGLHDMIGNVWEWTADWYAARHEADPAKACCTPANPRGPAVGGSYDPRQPAIRIPRRVVKGGSFLCSPSYCRRYRPAARQPQMVDSAMSHLGFRCVRRDSSIQEKF
jgi:sulfatase modifying factor 1